MTTPQATANQSLSLRLGMVNKVSFFSKVSPLDIRDWHQLSNVTISKVRSREDYKRTGENLVLFTRND